MTSRNSNLYLLHRSNDQANPRIDASVDADSFTDFSHYGQPLNGPSPSPEEFDEYIDNCFAAEDTWRASTTFHDTDIPSL